MSKIKDDIIKLFNKIFRKNNTLMIASATKENNKEHGTLLKEKRDLDHFVIEPTLDSESKATISNFQDKVNAYLNSLYMSSTTKTPQQITADVLQSEDYKRNIAKHSELNGAIDTWKEKSKYFTYRDKLELLRKDYSRRLSNFNKNSIDNALDYLDHRHRNHGKSEDDIELSDDAKKVFKLMHEYENKVKDIFVDNNIDLTHITSISPEKLEGGVLKRSKDRANNYETERVDGVFASSSPIDGNNPYIARNNTGMIRLGQSTYIYGDDDINVYQDSNGKNRAYLKHPNYIYHINPANFNPVCNLRINPITHKPEFEFSEEWISKSDIDISNPNQVRKIEQVRDVTSLLEHYTILSDTQSQGIGIQAKHCRNKDEALRFIKSKIKDGSIRNINHESGINDRNLSDIDIER